MLPPDEAPWVCGVCPLPLPPEVVPPFVATVTKGVFFMPKIKTRDLTLIALLAAIEIVLSRFLSIQAWNTKIGFSFVPIVVAAILLGPIPAAVVATIADIVGALLFPSGAFFPGFTLTACLSGLNYGLFLHKKQDMLHVLGAVSVHQLLLSLLLNTLWISILYGSPYKALLVTRSVQTVIIFAVQMVCIPLIAHACKQIEKVIYQ